MTDRECVALLQWALPRLHLRWGGFRRVRRQVCRRISQRMRELGLRDASAYRARLEADPAEWPRLDACCWISVSRFYRDRGVFEHLGAEILPRLARAALAGRRRVLRAWSVGCASGEEPFSVRLVWDLVVAPALPARAQLQILATDASATLLDRAARGVYPGSALKDLPPGWRRAAFDEQDGAFRLREGFRSGVELRREDVRERMPAGPFDLILCRNLAFTYFDDALQRDVAARLASRLRPGGALLVGAHESLPAPAPLDRSPAVPGLYEAGSPADASGPSSVSTSRSSSRWSRKPLL